MLPLDAGAKVSATQDSILDQGSLNSIKSLGRKKDPAAIREVAKKFEAMFVQQMLKSMRDANEVFSEGDYTDSSEERFHRDMLDQQMVLNLTSGRGIGLADQFYQNMMRTYGNELGEGDSARSPGQSGASNGLLNPATSHSNGLLSQPVHYESVEKDQSTTDRNTRESGGKMAVSGSPESFIAMLKPQAEKAAQALNVSPDVLLAQAALETGWGKHVIHSRNGDNSFNLFNVKANSQWQGGSINVNTLEYDQAGVQQQAADFRKYSSYAESFSDYVNLLKGSERYKPVLAAGSDSAAYADALQQAGYATDPAYAEKIKTLLGSGVIKAAIESGKLSEPTLTLASKAGDYLVE